MFLSNDELFNLMLLRAASGKPPVEATATGNPLTFTTDIARPLKSLLIPFTPRQSGTGDPSPENIRSILPWDGLTVYQSGADTSNPTETDIVFPSPVYGGTLDVVSGVLTVTMVARVFDGSSDEQWGGSSGARQIFQIQWSAVRGAQLDGKRVIACNMLIPSTNVGDNPSFGYIYNTQSEYNIRTHLVNEDITQEQFRALLAENPLVVVCPLVTPQEITLTPTQITALVGDNTIWSDTDGRMTAVYLKKA